MEYLVQNLDQIHSLLLTNFCLYFESDGITIFEKDKYIFSYNLRNKMNFLSYISRAV